MKDFPVKWRPTIGMITAAVIASVLLLPLIGLLFFRLYENQLVRQTEGELIAQAAVLAAVYADAIEAAPLGAFPIGTHRPPHDPAVERDERYAPILPSLDLALSPVLPDRPPARRALIPAREGALQVGARLNALTQTAQRTTLAGFRLLDANGVVISGREEVGASLAHLEEVRSALSGRFSAAMRVRGEQKPAPPLYSISRGTQIRVFVALPVFVDDRVRGVVYVSRTPDNILRQLYRERGKVAAAMFLVLAAAIAIGAVFVRTIARPMRDLAARAEEISRGRRNVIGPLPHHGTQELASLAQSFMSMAKQLSDRSDYLSTFANHVSHELKSPVTAIRGAAELMRDAHATMTPEERARFLKNVLDDADRISALLDRLRELARADNPELGGTTTLETVAGQLRDRFPDIEIVLNASSGQSLGLSAENAHIVFGHLIDNAFRHGAKRVAIEAHPEDGVLRLRIVDDGPGVSSGNRDRVFDPFFTTRRADGGTGMGLGIVRALLRAHGGDIILEDSDHGAAFALCLPAAAAPNTFS